MTALSALPYDDAGDIVTEIPPRSRFPSDVGELWAYRELLYFRTWAVPTRRARSAVGRKVHAVATPLLGGLAVYFAFALSVLFSFNFSRELKATLVGACLGFLPYNFRPGGAFEALGFTRAQSVFLIFSISTILGLSAILLGNATPRQAVVVLLQAVCVLVVIAVVESVGRGHPR